MSSASGVPTSSGATASQSFRGAVHKDGVERTAPLRRRMTRSKRLRSSVNDEEFCITHGYVRDARILPSRPCSRSGPTIDSTIAVVRANMQADRTALITAGMNFNDKDGAAFWPIYQQYEYERSRLDDRRVAVIKAVHPEVPEPDRRRGQSDGRTNVGLRISSG